VAKDWQPIADKVSSKRQVSLNKHRCDDHLEDIFTALFEDRGKLWSTWSNHFKCLRSPAGEEPPRVFDIDYTKKVQQQVQDAKDRQLGKSAQSNQGS